jgi:hypothetical protein
VPAALVEMGVVKDTNAAWETGDPPIVTNTGIHPGGIAPVAPAPVVEMVVLDPDAVNTMGVRFVFCCWNWRMAAAFDDVASASDARPAIANRISEERMDLFLPVKWKTSWIVVIEP